MMFGGLAGLAVDAMAGPVTLRRYPPGQYVEGEWSQGAVVTSTIQATLQSPSERDLRSVPEGDRTDAWITVWTRAELQTGDEDSKRLADEIVGADGQIYKVRKVARRDEAGFTRALARLITHDRGRSV